jgi:Methyltransferase domain
VADVYATITDADPALVAQIAEVLELRAADPQQAAMRQTYLGDIQFPAGARVLEVGCGTGAVTRELAGWPGVAEVVGLDPSPTFLATARVLRPGGWLAVFDGDYATTTVSVGPADPAGMRGRLDRRQRPRPLADPAPPPPAWWRRSEIANARGEAPERSQSPAVGVTVPRTAWWSRSSVPLLMRSK